MPTKSLFTTKAHSILLRVILIDLAVAGDNASVIGLAAGLAPQKLNTIGVAQ